MARRYPGSTLAAFLALTVGIGATTTIFSVVYSVLLQSLPFKDPDKVVRVFETKGGDMRADVSMADYLDWKTQVGSMESLAIYRETQANLTGQGTPQRVRVLLCESTMLPLLGIRPVRGRSFAEQENLPGRNDVAMLSWSFWQSEFGGGDVLGRKIVLDDKPHTIIGILPRISPVLGGHETLIPVAFDPKQLENRRGYHEYSVLGRLRPGVSVDQADTELATIAASLAAEYPRENRGIGALALNLRESLTGDIRPVLVMLFGAVSSVLLIACGNVANLLLVRASSRKHEMSVRVAIGASRGRLIRQLLTESIFVSLSAALTGLGFAYLGARIVAAAKNTGIPNPERIALDWHVLLFALATGLLTGIFFGLAPAVSVSTTRISDSLKQSAGRVTDSRVQERLRQLFVAFETGLAALLLIESGLLIKSFVKASTTQPGFSTDHLLTAQISLPKSRYGLPGRVGPFISNTVQGIESIPGVESSAVALNLPLVGSGMCSILTDSRSSYEKQDKASVQFNGISPDYFQTLEIPVLRGRNFTYTDTFDSQPVAIVNQTLARRFFGRENPIGRRIAYFSDHPQWKEIVGVVADIRQHGVENSPIPEIFTPLAQDEFLWLAIVARVTGDPLRFVPAIQKKVHQVDPDLAVFLPRTMDQMINRELGGRAFQGWLLSAFASFAIFLACIGIYAVIAYSVTQRISEIAVRMAVGASTADIMRMIVREGVVPALLGTIAGVICSFGVSRLLSGLLYGVQPMDPTTYLLVIGLLLAVSIAAAYVPARRAASLDPSQALRHQ